MCGQLEHGTKDCDDFHGEGSPVKNYTGSLKASPWRPVRESVDENYDTGRSTCARNIFVVQPRQEGIRSPIKDKLEKVALQLDKVDLRCEKAITQGVSFSKESVAYVDTSLASLGSNSSEVVGAQAVPDSSLHDTVKSYGRKWKRVPRKEVSLVTRALPHDKDSSDSITVGCSKRANEGDLMIYSSELGYDFQAKRACPMEITVSGSRNGVVDPTNRVLGGQ